MTTIVDQTVIQLLARTDRLERQLLDAQRVLDRRLGGMESRASQFSGKFNAALGAVSVAALAKELSGLSDASKQIEAQLQLATAQFGTFGKGLEDTRRIALSTRTSLEETTKLYGNFIRAAQDLGGSQEQAARATETFSKGLKIGGASSEDAANATRQFSQSLAGGILRAEEFNSVVEASPRVARLFAQGLGTSIGGLRKLVNEGKVSAQQLFAVLNDPAIYAQIDAEFKKLPTTFGDAMQGIENAAIITFGGFDRGGQFSQALLNFLSDGTTTFSTLEDAAAASGIEARAAFDGLKGVFEPLLTEAQGVFGGIRSEANYTRDTIASLLGVVDSVTGAAAKLGNAINDTGTGIRNGFASKVPILGGLLTRQQTPRIAATNFSGDFVRGFDSSTEYGRARERERRLKAFLPNPVDENGNILLNPFAKRQTTRPVTPDAKKGKTKRSPLNPDTFPQEQARLEEDILRARQQEAQTAEAAARVELDRVDNARQKAADRINSDKRLTDAEKKQLIALNSLAQAAERAAVIRRRDIEVEERTSAALRREYQSVEARNRNAQDTVRSQIDLAATARDRLELEQRLLTLAQQQERVDQEQLIADRQRILNDPNATPEAKAAARSDIGDAQAQIAGQDERFGNERKALERRYQGPLSDYADSVRDTVEDMDRALEGVQANGLQSLEDGLADVLSGTRSVSDAFSDMATSIIADIARIAIRQAVIAPILQSMGLNAGGTGAGGSNGLVAGDGANGLGRFLGGIGRVFGFAEGGQIRGAGTGRSDSILARVSNGEFIVNAASAAKHGAMLEAINADRMPRFADGGFVMPAPQLAIPTGANMQAARAPISAGERHFHISVDARNSVTPTGFARDLSSLILNQAAQMDQAAATRVVKEMPGKLSRYQRLGTI